MAEVFEKYSHDGNLSSYVQTATQEIFKAVTAKYSAPDLIAQRARVSNEVNAQGFSGSTGGRPASFSSSASS